MTGIRVYKRGAKTATKKSSKQNSKKEDVQDLPGNSKYKRHTIALPIFDSEESDSEGESDESEEEKPIEKPTKGKNQRSKKADTERPPKKRKIFEDDSDDELFGFHKLLK